METFKKYFPFSLSTVLKILGLGIIAGGVTHLVLQYGYHLRYQKAHLTASLFRYWIHLYGMMAIIALPFLLTIYESFRQKRFVPDVLLSIHRGFACLLGITFIFTLETMYPHLFISRFISTKHDFPKFFIVSVLVGIALAFAVGFLLRKIKNKEESQQRNYGKQQRNTDYIIEPRRFDSVEDMQHALSPDSDLKVPSDWLKHP